MKNVDGQHIASAGYLNLYTNTKPAVCTFSPVDSSNGYLGPMWYCSKVLVDLLPDTFGAVGVPCLFN